MYDLTRFLEAQEQGFDVALSEIASGRKRSHWMWFIFPQLTGLGHSDTAKFYAIANIDEAAEYLSHPVLGERLLRISGALLSHSGKSANEIFGSPDDMKLRSCMTLFAGVSNADTVFQKILDNFFEGNPDPKTLRLLV